MPDLFVSESKDRQANPKKDSQGEILGGKSIGLFTSYCENPIDISFQSQKEDTDVLVFLRAHWITKLSWIIATAILAIFPIAISIITQTAGIVFISIPKNYNLILMLFYYLFVFGYAFSNFLTWFYNVMIVTNKEIIDLDYSNLVYHDVSATNVNLVEDVNYTVTGFIRTFFNYGNLFVQTAGGKENIEAVSVPKPSKVARIILNLIGRGDSSG